jgi:cytochrome P450
MKECKMDQAGASMGTYETATCPFEYSKVLRESDPVHFDDGVGTYPVTRYDDVVEVLTDPERFTSLPVKITPRQR